MQTLVRVLVIRLEDILTILATDQLTVAEIIEVADVVQKNYENTPLKFNVITLKVSWDIYILNS